MLSNSYDIDITGKITCRLDLFASGEMKMVDVDDINRYISSISWS